MFLTNIGIYFSGAQNLLGPNGEIKVYDDDTGRLIHTFTASDWSRYNKDYPYKYNTSIKHIRITTSSTNPEGWLHVYNIKELDDEKIIDTYTREEFDDFKYIKSNVCMYLGENYFDTRSHQALYEAPYSYAKIKLSKRCFIYSSNRKKH